MVRDLVQFIESVRPEILQQEIVAFCQTLPEELFEVRRIQLTRAGTLAMVHYRMTKSQEEMNAIAKAELDKEAERLKKEQERVVTDEELKEIVTKNSNNQELTVDSFRVVKEDVRD